MPRTRTNARVMFSFLVSNGCVRYTRTREGCPAGFIHSVQSDVVEVQGIGRTAAAASKSPRNMGKRLPHGTSSDVVTLLGVVDGQLGCNRRVLQDYTPT